MSVKVGKPAPDFETKGYVNGEIKTVKLSDYQGQWVMLYFYPGDFTFV
jgi:peroxiredoxin (alkyl hydroperoxide reductase subunit C)